MSSGREKGTGPDVRQFDVFLFGLKILDFLSRFVCQCFVVGVVLKLNITKNDGPWKNMFPASKMASFWVPTP